MAIFAYLAYCEYKNGHVDRMILFIVLAILFQPFAKIALGRVIWNIVDAIVAGVYCHRKVNSFATEK